MVYIPTKEPPITPETTMENARKWLNIVRYSEYAVVIQFHDDCEYRVADIIENPRLLKKFLGPYYRKYLLEFIPVNARDLNSCLKESILETVRQRKIRIYDKIKNKTLLEIINAVTDEGYEFGLFISRINHLLSEQDFATLLDLERLLQQTRRCSAILFFDQNLSHPKYHFLIDKCSLLFDHVLKYPLYNEKDALQFINYNCEMWSMNLDDRQKKEIYALCGGYLWIISHVQRLLRDNPGLKIEEAAKDDMLLTKLETIWAKLLPEEKVILEKIAVHKLSEEDRKLPEYKHLQSIGAIKHSEGKDKLGVPLLSLVINNTQKLNLWSSDSTNIFINNKPFTKMFSAKETKLMHLLISHKKEIMPRDRIAQELWGKEWEEKYSDWAIDRLLYRIRQKIKQLGFNSNLLKTAKRKGVKFG